ncbi:DNRLRE domain-containing protein [Paenibacillus oralis]|uniref:DNRLRE domain-containing protein n=1 Tax=Paenibacillus oralis TaxID=2490856 RepID=A0A3P3U9Q9_9BACL|nr:DNRLRE domain-containing protein [Paenibacillus oralis]RRJ66416.1 DNRLRE domain-containing protein [Paenibacillus oralis]
MDEYHNFELTGEVRVKDRLSNKVTGKYKLYIPQEKELVSELVVMKPDEESLNSTISIRTLKNFDLPASIQVMYRGNDDIESFIEAMAGEYLEAAIQVRPYNRLFGKFELLEAPRKEVGLTPLADASTRSREDLRTINYGDTKSMLTGKNDEESFESFIHFGELSDRIRDLKLIESAKLRLYYIDFPAGSLIELHQPNTIWREMGVTHANKPYPTRLLGSAYTINTKERYIEFDLLDVANQWESGQLLNYGLIIRTPENNTLSFFTRESQNSPLLIIKYVTSQIYSLGRSQFDGTIFIIGKGNKDITGYLTVHSDVGLEYLPSTLYVHRYESPLFEEKNAAIGASRPDVLGQVTIAHRKQEYLEAVLTIANKIAKDYEADIAINVPDLYSWMNVDPNAHLRSILTVARNEVSEIDSGILVSRPDIGAAITISNYKRAANLLEGTLTVKTTIDKDYEAEIIISKPDLWGEITVRALGESSLDSTIDIPYYSNRDLIIRINTPDLPASMLIKYMTQIDGEILVKERNYLEASIDIRQIDELSGFLIAKQKVEQEADIRINVPDLPSTITPRVIGLNDLDVLASIRKRDVSDLNSSMLIKGKSNGSYWFIY